MKVVFNALSMQGRLLSLLLFLRINPLPHSKVYTCITHHLPTVLMCVRIALSKNAA